MRCTLWRGHGWEEDRGSRCYDVCINTLGLRDGILVNRGSELGECIRVSDENGESHFSRDGKESRTLCLPPHLICDACDVRD